MMRRGYSRDHRPDCEQMVIALIVNQDGFPFSYETFDGNRADVSTMEAILRMVERKYGQARRIWVMDRGIVSEENLAAIRRRNGQYLVGTPRSQMKQFEAELLTEDWTQVRPEVEVKQVSIPGGEETYILCRTAGRKEKEQAIRSRFSTRMEAALTGLGKTIVTGRLKDRYKMERRLGRIQAKHPQVNDLYQVELRDTKEGVRLFWEIKQDRQDWRSQREGAYMLRTNLQADKAEDLWSKYMQLTEAEASFRALKSELSIRPLFHQLEPRVKAHVMVAFLGYALWVTLKHRLRAAPPVTPNPTDQSKMSYSPMTALALLVPEDNEVFDAFRASKSANASEPPALAVRAAKRAPFLMLLPSNKKALTSIMPRITKRNNGATRAASTTVAPPSLGCLRPAGNLIRRASSLW